MHTVNDDGLWISTRPLVMSNRAWEADLSERVATAFEGRTRDRTRLVPLLPFVEFLRRRQHLEDVVPKLVVGDEDAARSGIHGSIQPVPIVIGAVWCCVQLLCDAKNEV